MAVSGSTVRIEDHLARLYEAWRGSCSRCKSLSGWLRPSSEDENDDKRKEGYLGEDACLIRFAAIDKTEIPRFIL